MSRKKEVQECLNCVELRKRIKELEEGLGVPQVFEGACWKGEDNVVVTRFDGGWKYEEHRKSKRSRKNYTKKYVIYDEEYLYLRKLFKDEFDKGFVSFEGGYFYGKIVLDKKLPMGRDAFNGGKNRGIYYELFYLPVKIMEFQGLIDYGGDGSIDFTDKLIAIFKGDNDG